MHSAPDQHESRLVTGCRVVFSRPAALQFYRHADVHTFRLTDLKRRRIATAGLFERPMPLIDNKPQKSHQNFLL